MSVLVFLLIVAAVALWSRLISLAERVTTLDGQLHASKDEIQNLVARIARLERGQASKSPAESVVQADAAPAARPDATPLADLPIAVTRTPPPLEPEALPERPAPRPPIPAALAPTAPADPPPSPAPRPKPVPQPVLAAAVPSAASATVDQRESWEMVVGTSWLNKIGVLVFVIGVALLVGYSFARIGPAGRVAIGYVLSFGMLGGGVFLERRTEFRNYAYGLVAGGWAGVYFTTFAMHDVAAAKIIESDVVAATLLLAVAAGMIAHSLRYRSQVVTALAFVVGYATLALSPLSAFSLAASIPLAVSLLVVSQRLGWPGVSALGITASYGAFVLRGAVFPGGVMDPHAALPYLTLASYWVTFEAADIIGLRLRHRSPEAPSGSASVSMLALNAIGFMGAMLMTVPGDNPRLLSIFLFGAASAYLTSAVLRAWLLPGWRARHDRDEPFDTTHGATGIAAGLFALAIGLRFSGNRETLARLLEAQLLMTAGLTLGDVWLRRMGSIGMALAAGSAWLFALSSGAGTPLFWWSLGTTTAVTSLIAVACYGNREAMHRRGAKPVWLEGSFTWMASALVVTVLVLEFEPAHQALAGLVLAALLLETGLRRSAEYIHQSYVVGGLAAYGMLAAFLGPTDAFGAIATWGQGPTTVDEWIVLPAGVVLAATMAWRLSTRANEPLISGRLMAAGAWGILATAFLLVFEWRVLSADAIAPAWALTAVGLAAIGAWRRQASFRWQGYAVALGALVRAAGPLVEGPPDTASQTVAILMVIAAVYAVTYLGRRDQPGDASRSTAGTGDSLEPTVTAALSVVATGAFVLFKWRVLPDLLVAPAWAATALVLMALGIYRERQGQRLQAYALAAIASYRLAGGLLAQPTAGLEPSLWAIVVIACIYSASWLERRSAARTADPDILRYALPVFGTVALAVLQSRVVADLGLGPAWTLTGTALLALGLLRRVRDLRWQGYMLIAFGALRAGRPVFGVDDAATAAIAWLGLVIVVLYAVGLMVRRAERAAEAAGSPDSAEDPVGSALLLGATGLLAGLIVREAQPSMVTLALGLQGLALMFTGLVSRERVLRVSGLSLLLACILKLFIYDLRELEAIARIMSFVMLGLFLLAISWTYTRYREQIRKFL